MPEFRMPSLGADMDEGTLLEWLVAPGDEVHRGSVVAVVDTDKAAIEVEAFDDGIVESLVVPAGTRVPVGTVLATLSGAPAAAAAVPTPPPTPAAVPPTPTAPPPTAPLITSPLVRHLAEDRHVDLATVSGSGPGGVIHRADVVAADARRSGAPRAPAPDGRRRRPASPLARRLAAQGGLDLARVSGTGEDGTIRAVDVQRTLSAAPAPPAPTPTAPPPAAAARPSVPPPAADDAERTAAMRRAVANLMARSNREIPHYYLTASIDLSAGTAWLRERNRELSVSERLVPAALLLAATARAARDVPALNGHWLDDGFRPSATVELGVVVSLRRGGILAPVIPDAATLSVERTMTALRELVERARRGRLRSSDQAQPSITVTSLGDQGVDSVLGVVYPPQVALVGFGAVVERPWAVNGLLGVRPVVVATLAADHRATDGAIGARLLNRINALLQKPEEL